ncbi:MAG: hypothetical protein FJ098_11955, partial [Deltaproteobacteria bacterium]|nr:hypothetical protein [Deltaproteobacteria bacterium]
QGGATLLSTAPSGTMVLCDDPTDTVCEENFGTLCPAGWHLCSHKEYNARNTGWTFSPLTRALGTIQCRSSSGAGHFTLPDQGNVGAVLNQDVAATNCWFGSSRPTCTASFGCNEQYSHALCCVTHPLCGNGVKDEPEEDCDDGNASETDPCLNNCSFRVPGMSYQGCS